MSEVLAAVQRTGESLRRLKHSREKPNSASQQMTTSASDKQLITDDDKIRLQFKLDSIYYASQTYIIQKDLKIDCLLQLIEELSKHKL